MSPLPALRVPAKEISITSGQLGSISTGIRCGGNHGEVIISSSLPALPDGSKVTVS